MSIPVVYDTMIFLQMAARPARVHATYQAVLEKRVALALSPALLAEVHDVLNRPNVRAKFPALTSAAVDVFLANLISHGTLADVIPNQFTWPEHPDDDHLFNLAIHAQARYLVTWETRILKLAADQSEAATSLRRLAPQLQMVTPTEFVKAIFPKKL